MKTSRHCGQVISNDDGFNPVKILGDLHAKSVKEFEDQNIYPSNREGKSMLKFLRLGTGIPEMDKSPRTFRRWCLVFTAQIVFE